MITTFAEAYDAILATFKAKWDADTPALNSMVAVPVIWPNCEQSELPQAPWARVTVRHNLFSEASLGGTGNRTFTYSGVVIVQIFTTLGVGVDLSLGLSKIAHDAFAGKHDTVGGSVWFRNTFIREVGPEDKWFQVNVYADFRYDVAA